MTRKRLDELLARLEPRMAKRFRSVMSRVKSSRTLAEIENALSNGTIGALLDDVEKAAAHVAAGSAEIHTLAATETAVYLSDRLGAIVSYDGSNPRAVEALARNRLALVQGLTEDARLAIGEALRGGLVDGENPRASAIAVRDSIGLTPNQTQYVANYRRALMAGDRHALTYKLRDARSDAAVRAAIAAGKPLPQARIDKMVDRYAERQLKYRAEVIARTETLRSLHEGNEESYQQAIDGGQIDADRLQLKWNAGDPPRTRNSHARMDGQLRRHGEPFRSGDGYALRYPHDPNAPASETAQCRCRVTRRVLPEGEAAVSEGDATNPHAEEDKANRAAVKAMKKRPMATSDHPSFDAAGLSAAQRAAFEDDVAKTFGKRIPVSEMTHAFAPPRGFTARFDEIGNEGRGPKIGIGYYTADGARIGTLVREFRPNGEMHLGLLAIERDYQRAGIASTVNGQTYLRAAKWGVKEETLDALWVGRYSWARQGTSFAGDTAPILAAGEKFIAAHVPEDLRAKYSRTLRQLAKEPWKLAKWDDGKAYDVFFDDGDGQATGSYAFGKAFLLHHDMPAWAGRMKIDPFDEGWLNALRLLAVQGRL